MGKFDIQTFTVPGTSIIIATDADEVLTPAFNINGRLVGLKVTTPDLDGTDTVTVKVEDADGFVLYSKASIAESAKTFLNIDANNHPLKIPVSGSHKVRITASSDQDANRVFVVKLLVDKG